MFNNGEIQNNILTPDKKLNILMYETRFYRIRELQYNVTDSFWPLYNKTNKMIQYVIPNTD